MFWSNLFDVFQSIIIITLKLFGHINLHMLLIIADGYKVEWVEN